MLSKFAPLLLCLTVLGSAMAQTAQQTTPHGITATPRNTEMRPKAENLPSEATVNSFLKEYFGYEQGITWKIQSIRPSTKDPALTEVDVVISGPQGQQGLQFYVTPDEKHAMVGELIPFGAHPFAETRQELQKATGPTKGPASAPVTIVEFSDLQCPHCKAAEPIVERLLSEEPNVHFIWENFPLPSHDWAFKAASYADCLGRENKDAFWKFVKGVFDAQEQITAQNADEKLGGIVTAAGGNAANVAACAAKPETADRVKQSVALGKTVDVTGTPTLFINGRKIGNVTGAPYEFLKAIVDYDGKPAAAAKPSGK